MNKFNKAITFISISFVIIAGCGPGWDNEGDNKSCSGSKLECGNVCCPDSTHYSCVNQQCKLTSCKDGYYFCGKSCIPLNSVCCSHSTGEYCIAQQCCQTTNGFSCAPLGSTCCGLTGRYCPFGRGCNANGTTCY